MAGTDQGATRLGPPVRADAGASAAREEVLAATRRLAALAALALAACGAPTTPPPPAEPPAPAPAAPAPPPQAAAKPEPTLSPLDRYKRTVAERILKANAAHTFEGVPPHLLRAVIVLQLTIDAQGKLVGVKTLRTPDQKLAAFAAKSARDANPLPPPPRELLRRGQLEFAETWLFRDDGKFQVRSLAAPQPTVVD
jgi:protein TonB